MRAWSKIDPQTYRSLDLHAHRVLEEVPLHDVWQVELPGGGEGRTVADFHRLMSFDSVAEANPVVGFLFKLRGWLGSIFGWDAAPRESAARGPTLLDRVPKEVLERSLEPPGSPDGPFNLLYALDGERVSEVRNATVRAYSVLAMKSVDGGYRAFWAIHVASVGPITGFYMALIAPFRRFLVYPAILRHVHRAWVATIERGNA